MINIDDRLLSEADADETYLLLNIARHMNKENFAFPSNSTLCQSTGWGIKKLQKVKASCFQKQLIEMTERYRENGGQSSNGYIVKSSYISVFVNLKDKGVPHTPEMDRGVSQKGIGGVSQKGTPPHTPERDRDISINNKEVLTIEREKTPAPETSEDVRHLIAQSSVNGDNIESRMKIWSIVAPYLSTPDFKNLWDYITGGRRVNVSAAQVVKEWVDRGIYYDVKEFKIHKIGNWVKNAAREQQAAPAPAPGGYSLRDEAKKFKQ